VAVAGTTLWSEVNELGFTLVREAVTSETLSALMQETERLSSSNPDHSHGLRGLLTLSPKICSEAGRFFGLPLELEGARPLRAILFDKRPDANWRIGWHQDTNLKENGASLVSNDDLGKVFTLRLHLDPTPTTNGALRCLPGSHKWGRQADFRRSQSDAAEHVIEAMPGDILVMRPLLFHASSPATQPARRRVIHVDYLVS
jgi:hypothetical protein